LNSSSFGYDAQATAEDACAVGLKCRSTAQNAASGGVSSQALGIGSSAFGHNATANSTDSCAFGPAIVTGLRSIGVGTGATTEEPDCVSLGSGAYCGVFPELTSVGAGSECNLAAGTVVGFNAILAIGAVESCAFGHTARSDAANTVVIGNNSTIFPGGDRGVCIGATSSIQINATDCVNIGQDAGTNSIEAVTIGRRAANGVDAAGSIALGTRANVESPASVTIGTGTTISNDSSASVLVGDSGQIAEVSSACVAIGSNTAIDPNCGKSTLVGGDTRARAPNATTLGWGSTTTVTDGVSLGLSAAADPLGAFPGVDEDLCPLALNVNASVVELTTANPGTQAGWIFIRINGSRYRIRLWENADPVS
jgi:hypothetical protein